jgi:hypothetical protein
MCLQAPGFRFSVFGDHVKSCITADSTGSACPPLFSLIFLNYLMQAAATGRPIYRCAGAPYIYDSLAET